MQNGVPEKIEFKLDPQKRNYGACWVTVPLPGLLLRNLNSLTITQIPCYLLYIHIMVT